MDILFKMWSGNSPGQSDGRLGLCTIWSGPIGPYPGQGIILRKPLPPLGTSH